MNRTVISRECGTFDDACNRAAAYTNRHNGNLSMAETFLGRAGWLHATFGVEVVSVAGRELQYLNTGDTYDLTLGQESDGPILNTSWGDWVEQAEQEHCETRGVIRCCYCGEFTPDLGSFTSAEEPWDKIRCEHCGHNPATGE
jgi:hypothetical protein